jgi:hypothetical protein
LERLIVGADIQAALWICFLMVAIMSVFAAGLVCAFRGRGKLAAFLFVTATVLYISMPLYIWARCGVGPCPSSKLLP